MNYKELNGYLIAFDLDNTSVTGFDNYDKESFEILKELSINNYVVIATGRPYRSSKYFYDILNLDTPIINYNGAYVHNPKDKGFNEIMLRIDHNKLASFLNDNKDHIINAFSEVRDDIYLEKKGPEVERYIHYDGGALHEGRLSEILKDDPNGCILFSKPESEDALTKYINDNFKEARIRHYWIENNINVSEIYNPHTSKANALDAICTYYKIDKEKTISFGDGINDLDMLQFSKYGVAMANSSKDLLQKAKYITKSVHESGIKYFFKTFDFENK